jgi:hypothetical protein
MAELELSEGFRFCPDVKRKKKNYNSEEEFVHRNICLKEQSGLLFNFCP